MSLLIAKMQHKETPLLDTELFVGKLYVSDFLTNLTMIIESLLDTDLYKFSMMQAVLHQHPAARVEYRFFCRTPNVSLGPLAKAIRNEVASLCTLRFSEEELQWLARLRYVKPDFVEFLRLFHLQERFVEVDNHGGQLNIRIRGPWLHTILFEVPVLAIVSELYHRHMSRPADLSEGRHRLADKISQLQLMPEASDFVLAEFGTRRRYARNWQHEVVTTLKRGLPGTLRGTSNVLLARELGLSPIGTMGHEWLQAAQALGPRLADAQRFALQSWANEYRGDLGIALSDNYGLNAFLNDFDLYFCKLFDGVRHDSGDPVTWGEMMLEHYRKMRIDPLGKQLVFTDALTFQRAINLFRHFNHRAKVRFGIGTYLTNDVGVKPLSIVIKMTRCNGHPVAKVSDDPGKSLCDDPTYLAYLRQVYRLEGNPGAEDSISSRQAEQSPPRDHS